MQHYWKIVVIVIKLWLWDHIIKFNKWQHPAMECGAKCAEYNKTCFKLHVNEMFPHINYF